MIHQPSPWSQSSWWSFLSHYLRVLSTLVSLSMITMLRFHHHHNHHNHHGHNHNHDHNHNHHCHHELTVCVSYPLLPPTSLPSSLHCGPGGPSYHEPDHDDDIDYEMMMAMITWATEARNSCTAATSLADKRESRSREWKRSTLQLKSV